MAEGSSGQRRSAGEGEEKTRCDARNAFPRGQRQEKKTWGNNNGNRRRNGSNDVALAHELNRAVVIRPLVVVMEPLVRFWINRQPKQDSEQKQLHPPCYYGKPAAPLNLCRLFLQTICDNVHGAPCHVKTP